MRRRNRFSGKKNPVYLEESFQGVDLSSTLYTKEEKGYSEFFLGLYDKNAIMDILTQSGIINVLNKRGYYNLILTISRNESLVSRLYVNFDSLDRDTRLIELLVRQSRFKPKQTFIDDIDLDDGFSTLTIEWLCLQDPKREFTKKRPKLPGQVYPGLGALRNMQELLCVFANTTGSDAILDIPEHYHGAVIYSEMYSFFSPIDGGRLNAMMRDLKGSPLADVSYGICYGCLINEHTGENELWKPSEQIYPTSKRLKNYANSTKYKEILEDSANTHKYSIDWDRYQKLLEEGILDEI